MNADLFDDFLKSVASINPRLKDFIKALGFEHHNIEYLGTNAAIVKVDDLIMHFFISGFPGHSASFIVYDTSYKTLDKATFKWVKNEWRENDE